VNRSNRRARQVLVAALFGSMSTLSRIVYVLVGIAALYGIVLAARLGSRA
jgi:uncharacterized membrane protein YuzA (DUF378 family)